jgi:hypothetical protein
VALTSALHTYKMQGRYKGFKGMSNQLRCNRELLEQYSLLLVSGFDDASYVSGPLARDVLKLDCDGLLRCTLPATIGVKDCVSLRRIMPLGCFPGAYLQ